MKSEWTIIVAERGWIYVGKAMRVADRVVLSDAYVVRRFSLETKDGLGMLAERGPKKDNDVLDPAPRGIGIGVAGVVSDFPCNPEPWDAWHAKQTKVRKCALYGSGYGSGYGYGYGDGSGYGSGYGDGSGDRSFPEQEIGGARDRVAAFSAREGINAREGATFGDILQLMIEGLA